MNQVFEITDDTGYMGIFNAQKYQSFVDEDWEFDQLKERLLAESNKGHILFWGTDIPGIWQVRVCDAPVAQQEFKSFSGYICVTDAILHLINYESLTLAAQFDDEQLPEEHLADLCVPLDNGIYQVTVRQLFDPEHDAIEDGALGFEIVLQAATISNAKKINQFTSLPWSLY